MGQEIATREQANTALASATPFSLTSLTALIPEWLNRGLFEDDHFALPQIIPEDGPKQLRAVADRFRHSLEDFAERKFLGEEIIEGKRKKFFDDPLDGILGELRLRTMIRSEHQEEARARFRLLRDDCRAHAIEVVREACVAYAKANKFFPAGYAELKPHIMFAQNSRQRTMHRLRETAKQAETIQERQKRVDDDPVDPEELSAFVEEMQALAKAKSDGIGSGRRGKPISTANLRMPTTDELAALAAEQKGATP